jgi:hypothetical protein
VSVGLRLISQCGMNLEVRILLAKECGNYSVFFSPTFSYVPKEQKRESEKKREKEKKKPQVQDDQSIFTVGDSIVDPGSALRTCWGGTDALYDCWQLQQPRRQCHRYPCHGVRMHLYHSLQRQHLRFMRHQLPGIPRLRGDPLHQCCQL